jgi:glycosyltransferase involved in cell wall biosynthesis
MNILVVSQYFWPENFRINDLCIELKKRGHTVSVLTGNPNYPNGKFEKGYSFFNCRVQYFEGIKIYRSSIISRGNGRGLRLIINYASFALFSSIRLLFIKEKYDKILVYQLSPGTVGIPATIASIYFKCPIIFYIQDLWPESLTDAGGINSKIVINFIDKLMNYFYNKSEFILVQSRGFINHLVKKGVSEAKIIYIPNTVESFYRPIEKTEHYKNMLPSGFNILFAGNIGFAQDFATIIKAAKELEEKNIDVNWIILGEGRAKSSAISLIEDLNLQNKFFFLGAFPSEEMPHFFSCADLLLVSLKKSQIFSLTIPSKIQSYLACKKTIIANLDGIGADIISEAKAGICSNSGDYNKLSENIRMYLAMSDSTRQEFAENGYQYFLKEFERNIIYNKLEAILLS